MQGSGPLTASAGPAPGGAPTMAPLFSQHPMLGLAAAAAAAGRGGGGSGGVLAPTPPMPPAALGYAGSANMIAGMPWVAPNRLGATGIVATPTQDKKGWNSDDEEIDEFGRRKRKVSRPASGTPGGAVPHAPLGMAPWMAAAMGGAMAQSVPPPSQWEQAAGAGTTPAASASREEPEPESGKAGGDSSRKSTKGALSAKQQAALERLHARRKQPVTAAAPPAPTPPAAPAPPAAPVAAAAAGGAELADPALQDPTSAAARLAELLASAQALSERPAFPPPAPPDLDAAPAAAPLQPRTRSRSRTPPPGIATGDSSAA